MSKPKIDLSFKSQIKISEVPHEILIQLLTPSELKMLKNRFAIIQHLQKGLSIRKVAELLKVGTDTVVRVAKIMKVNNFTKKTPAKTNTSWVFGKNS